MSIVFIGTGNVATNLASVFKKKTNENIHIHGRTERSAKQLAEKLQADCSFDPENLPYNSSLYIISVTDDALSELSENPVLKEKIDNNLVIHTAGSVPVDILKSLSGNYGVFYPLQTFSKYKLIDFKTIPLCLEANTGFNYDKLSKYAFQISEDVRKINSEQRKYIHLAAVFANNFSNRMFAIAENILKEKQIDFDILLPLIKETVEKIKNNSPGKVQTGPAVRNDQKVIDKHSELLNKYEDLQKIYNFVSKNISNNK
ncbi:MAG: DUF2520 domain-containing protein [Bacteroidales bacterium]|nr:DUF2520 domain-containing protein [Bacteroidales bacterium]